MNQNYFTYYKELPTIAPPPPPFSSLPKHYPTEYQKPKIFTRKDGSGGMKKNKIYIKS